MQGEGGGKKSISDHHFQRPSKSSKNDCDKWAGEVALPRALNANKKKKNSVDTIYS